MAQIRDTDIVRTPEVTIDPRLFIPGNVIDIGVKSSEIDPDTPTSAPASDDIESNDTLDNSSDTNTGTGDAGSDPVYEGPSNPPVEGGDVDTLPTPQSIVIVSQTIRIAPDGSSLVDVVIDVEEIPGVTNYDVRVTKA